MLDDLLDIEYLRLSKEDGDDVDGNERESCSIDSQRKCIHRYLRENGFDLRKVEEIVDDGYSGTSMNRPGMERLLAMVEEGRVRTIIVRDLSRFARNYLDAGHYLEFVFPAYGVRFISINDQFDSQALGEDTGGLELAIRNLLNQMYSRDISRKIKTAVDLKKMNGEFVYGTAPYGYKKGPQKNTIVIDEEVAPVVKQIFIWASEGVTITQIARKLNDMGIQTPSAYLASVRGKYKVVPTWSFESVRNILENRIYTGDTVPFKSHVVRVGSDRVKQVPLDQQMVIPNTHEAIISRELFYQSQNTKSKHAPKKYNPLRERYVFTSVLRCSCCGNRLIRGKAQNKDWRCTTHRYDPEKACKDIRFTDSVLQDIVLRSIKTQSQLLDAKIKRLRARSHFAKSSEQVVQDECKLLRKQLETLQAEKMSNYEKMVGGSMSRNEFMASKVAQATREEAIKAQLNLSEKKLEQMQAQARQQAHSIANSKRIVDYQDIERLTPELVKELIQHITVYPDGKIKIVWNFSDEISSLLEQASSAKDIAV